MEQEPENIAHIQEHFVTHDHQLSLLVKMDKPHQVMEEVDVRVGLIAALMHDTGYIQKPWETLFFNW